MSIPPSHAAFDVAIVGGGPAGAACAAFCAAAGLRVAVIERAVFPRDKVCGDCLNPDAWPVLARLGLEERVRALPHTALRTVEFVGLRGAPVRLPLPEAERGEIAVKRRDLDALLLTRAAELGADVRQGQAVSAMRWEAEETPADGGGHYALTTAADDAPVRGRFLVAADGRNSLVARLTGLLAEIPRRNANARIGLQAHVPCPADFGARVQMRWFADGYGGLCPVGGGELNVSLTGPPAALEGLKRWVRAEFGPGDGQPWRTIAPLDRAPARRAAVARGNGGVFLLGDAARVVEPFTGEGIYYALRSGELAAAAIVAAVRGETDAGGAAARYREAHARMYRGRLWVNRLARAAGRHPRWAAWALAGLRWRPELLRFLTAKVVAADRGREDVS